MPGLDPDEDDELATGIDTSDTLDDPLQPAPGLGTLDDDLGLAPGEDLAGTPEDDAWIADDGQDPAG